MHPTIPAETLLRHLTEQATRDRRIPGPRRPLRHSEAVLRGGRAAAATY